MHMATERLEWNSWNGHLVRSDADAYLLHVPTTAVFGVDALGLSVIEHCRETGGRSVEELVALLADRYPPARVRGFAAELQTLGMLQPSGSLRPINPRSVKVNAYPLSTLVLNVNTGCNLSCTYCYKEDLAKPAAGRKMDFVTAARSVDLLLEAGAARERINIVFFGGEPLTNVALIKQVVDYAEGAAVRAGKSMDFSMTTNATLLTPALIDYFDAHRFGISVSMDGPKIIHDRHRKSVGGRGTYEVVARKVRLLLERYRSRPVGARVTLGGGTTEVEAIHAHLRGEIGFHEVGYAPVTAAAEAGHALSDAELAEVQRAFERLGEDYRQAALRGANNGFSNMHQLMTDLHQGRRKSLPCGAGVGLLAVDGEGDLNRTYHYCDLLRRWVDFGVRVYADIQRHNPNFFTRHLEPRSAIA